MSREHERSRDLRIQSALVELQGIIQKEYPTATFQVANGDDPEGIYLMATVDVQDTEAVIDVFIDRLLELQVEERLPVYVIPLRPPERIAALHRKDS
ncbi:MAG: hypothetical protein HY731_11550 [Candidatus Tectomicrobia bacterium]|nr:hypothetical protein [Candidatus Tectomicrobia bacterium]